MKKIFAVLVMLCLALTVAASAEVAEVNWEEVAPTLEALGLEGDFATFDEVAVKIWIPSSMQRIELTDEDVQNGYIGYFLDDDETAQVAVVYANVEGMSLAEYAEQLPEYGAENIVFELINGLEAVEYTLPENDSLNVAFATQAGYVLEVTMAPNSVEGADIAWGIVGSSIQPE